MFTNLWKKCVQWQSSRRRHTPHSTRVIPRIETLEDRITPANYNATIALGVMTLARTTGGAGGLTITSTGAFDGFLVTATFGSTISVDDIIVGTTFTNPLPNVSKIAVLMGNGSDTLLFDGSGVNGPINLSAGLTITGTGGDKNITLKDVNVLSHSALALSLTGNGTENTTFTDVNVNGAASIFHSGIGNTFVTFNTTNLNPIFTNNWDTLTITNGTGSDTNTIQDTDFAGNVLINNGAGSGTGQWGGSQNIFSAGNNSGLLNASGTVTVKTTSGQSDTEIYDYDVKGLLSINTGVGIVGQPGANVVGIENKQTNVAVPTFGAISITGYAVPSLSPGLTVDMGTGGVGQDFPVFVAGPLTISANGSFSGGAATILLNDLNVAGATSITLAKTTFNDNVTIQGDNAISNYAAVTVTSSAIGADAYNVQTIAGTTNVTGALTFHLTSATDTINTGLGITGVLNTSGNLAITGVSGNKTLNINGANLGGVSMVISGTGAETATFTDTNVLGAASITHNNLGTTNFTITTSNLNLDTFNSWNSLTITNGTGSDTNTINDTSFAGNVTINNGAGSGAGLFGGSHTVFSDNLNPGLLTIHGNLVITTISGRSDTEVYDYNVNGNTTISSGNGIAGQPLGNLIGLENNQTVAGSGTPVFAGNVTITATAVKGINPGVTLDMGTGGGANQNFPLMIIGNLLVTENGASSALLDLNDVIAPYGTTTITEAATTANNTLDIQGTSVTSVYWNLVISSLAGGNNFYNLQDSVGVLQMTGTIKATFGNGNDSIDLGADASNPNGTPGAVLELFSLTSALFNGGNGVNFHWIAPGATEFGFQNPIFILI